MNKEEMNKIFDETYQEVNAKRNFEKPFFKISYFESSTLGACVYRGYEYSKHKPVIRLNAIHCSSPEKTRMVLIHEFAHLIDYNSRGKSTHDKIYWTICKELGYDPADYPLPNRHLKKVFNYSQANLEVIE